jgi:hypothetical protein
VRGRLPCRMPDTSAKMTPHRSLSHSLLGLSIDPLRVSAKERPCADLLGRDRQCLLCLKALSTRSAEHLKFEGGVLRRDAVIFRSQSLFVRGKEILAAQRAYEGSLAKRTIGCRGAPEPRCWRSRHCWLTSGYVTRRHSAATHLVEFRPAGILNRRFQGHTPEHKSNHESFCRSIAGRRSDACPRPVDRAQVSRKASLGHQVSFGLRV